MTHFPTHQEPHESEAFPADPVAAFAEAMRVARAASHSKRLDTATQAALQAIVQAGHAAVDAMRHQEQRIAAIETRRQPNREVDWGGAWRREVW